MAAATDIGTGATLVFADEWVFEITELSWSGIERTFIDSSHLGTTVARTFIVGDLYDPGSLTIQGHLDQDSSGNPIITGAISTVTLAFPNGKTYVAQGALQSFEIGVPLEDKMTVTAVIKFSGAIAFPA